MKLKFINGLYIEVIIARNLDDSTKHQKAVDLTVILPCRKEGFLLHEALVDKDTKFAGGWLTGTWGRRNPVQNSRVSFTTFIDFKKLSIAYKMPRKDWYDSCKRE